MNENSLKNLKSNSERTPKERKLLASKAGKKSGMIRKEKRKMREILETLLSMEVIQDKTYKSAKEAMVFSVVKKAINGDLKAVEWIQSCIEEKPNEKGINLTPQALEETQAIIDKIIGSN